jgi:hypothetical protein
MADPLSVAASVVGLLTAAAQVSKIVANVISKARHAPEECGRIKSEVDDIRNVLVALQIFILNPRQVSCIWYTRPEALNINKSSVRLPGHELL